MPPGENSLFGESTFTPLAVLYIPDYARFKRREEAEEEGKSSIVAKNREAGLAVTKLLVGVRMRSALFLHETCSARESAIDTRKYTESGIYIGIYTCRSRFY